MKKLDYVFIGIGILSGIGGSISNYIKYSDFQAWIWPILTVFWMFLFFRLYRLNKIMRGEK